MRVRQTTSLAAAALLAMTTAACGTTASVTTPPPVASPTVAAPTVTTPPTTDATRELEALYRARQDSAMMRFTEADVVFMTGMIGHHAQALVMSELAPTNSTNAQVQTLAARIINAQRDEIATMQQWLRDRGQPVPEVHIEGTNLMLHGAGDHGMHMDHMNMPGMLTQAQIDELAAARGADFDRLFLTYMIQHHGGAVTMVDTLFGTDGAAQDEAAFKFASDVQVDQRTEIARMQRMLDEMSDTEQ